MNTKTAKEIKRINEENKKLKEFVTQHPEFKPMVEGLSTFKEYNEKNWVKIIIGKRADDRGSLYCFLTSKVSNIIASFGYRKEYPMLYILGWQDFYQSFSLTNMSNLSFTSEGIEDKQVTFIDYHFSFTYDPLNDGNTIDYDVRMRRPKTEAEFDMGSDIETGDNN